MGQLLPEDKAALDQMTVDLESLRTFEREVQAVLADMSGGDVSLKNPVAGAVSMQDFGQDFEEGTAVSLLLAFTEMRISDLADKLHQHIEAMALTVKMASDSTAAAEESNRHRMAKMLYDLGLRREDGAPAAAVDGVPTKPSNAQVG
jgi:hypothetical protein